MNLASLSSRRRFRSQGVANGGPVFRDDIVNEVLGAKVSVGRMLAASLSVHD